MNQKSKDEIPVISRSKRKKLYREKENPEKMIKSKIQGIVEKKRWKRGNEERK